MARKIKGFVTDKTLKRRIAHERSIARHQQRTAVACAERRARGEMYHEIFDMEDLLKDTIASVKLSEGKNADYWAFWFSFHKHALFDSPWPIKRTIQILAHRVHARVEELLFEMVRNQEQNKE